MNATVTINDPLVIQTLKRLVQNEAGRLRDMIDGFDPASSDVARLQPEIERLTAFYERLANASPFVDPTTGRMRRFFAVTGRTTNRHLYEIGVGKDGLIGTIEVDAHNRAQAARIAERNGYEVRDVNMTG